MSLFTSNRFSNISINNSDNVNEDTSVAKSDSNAGSTLSEDIQESNINLDNYIKENSTGVMTSVSNIIENDNNLFSRLLEADFIDVCEKLTLKESVNDADIEKKKYDVIRHEINKLYEDTISSIAYESKKFVEKLQSFLESEQKTFDKYMVYMNTGLLESFKPIGKISFPDEVKANVTDSILDLSGLSDIFNEAIKEINDANDDMVNIVENYYMRIVKDKDNIKEKIDSIVETSEWHPDAKSVEFIRSFNDPSIFINNIKESTNTLIENIKTFNEDSYNDFSSTNVFSKHITEDNSVKNYCIYEMSSAILKEVLNRVNIYNDLIIREVADVRKALIVYGRFAMDESKGIETKDSIIKSISESSDIYTYNKFSQEVK